MTKHNLSDPPLRVALISAGEIFGGVERHLVGLASWLRRNGHDVALLLFHDRELAAQARSVEIEPRIIAGAGLAGFIGARSLSGVLADYRPDVMHAHGYRAVVASGLANGGRGAPLVRTVHGIVEPRPWYETGYVKSVLYRSLEDIVAAKRGAADCFVTNDLRRRFRKRRSASRAVTIHNGIDPLDAGKYERPAEFDGSFEREFVAVGRVGPVKAFHFAVEAVARTSHDCSLRLNIIGSGPDEDALRDLVHRRNVGDRVPLLGFRRNIFDYLAHADGLVVSSIYEGLPYTVLEAMSLGCVILASRVGGLCEVIEDGQSGILFPVGDVERLSEIFRLIQQGQFDLSTIAACGKARQKSHFSLDAMGRKYIGTYRDVIDGN